MLKLFKIFFFINFFFLYNLLYASECSSNSKIKIGLIENDFFEYQYYLYYELGSYAADTNLEFEIELIKNNVDEFDIIFGEYNDLIKLSTNNIKPPREVNDFYSQNNIKISGNIFPLDLDTFIIVSQSDQKKVDNLEELSNFYDPIRYTLGISFKSINETAEFLSYNVNFKDFEIKSIENESLLSSLKASYKNFNKNILFSDYSGIVDSYENNENVYTLFSDGILLNKNFNYFSYQLFPQSKYIWNNDKGIFIERVGVSPFSYYGFSAYINNVNQFGFLCHLLKEKVRENSFRNFNISLGPLSAQEVKNFNKLPKEYLDILNSKNQNIMEIDYKNFSTKYELIKNIIFGNENYQNSIETNGYLNN